MKTTLLAWAVLAMAVRAVPAAAAGAPSEWYVNMKYGFSIAYPKGVFQPQGEAADGSGRKFRSADGKAVVSVYGYDGPANSTLTSAFNETLAGLAKEEAGWKVTHKSIRGDSFIVQGSNGTASFYKKVVFKPRERQFVAFEAVYAAAKGKACEPLVSSMSGSLKLLQAAGAGR